MRVSPTTRMSPGSKPRSRALRGSQHPHLQAQAASRFRQSANLQILLSVSDRVPHPHIMVVEMQEKLCGLSLSSTCRVLPLLNRCRWDVFTTSPNAVSHHISTRCGLSVRSTKKRWTSPRSKLHTRSKQHDMAFIRLSMALDLGRISRSTPRYAQLPAGGTQGWRACVHTPGLPTRGAPPAAASSSTYLHTRVGVLGGGWVRRMCVADEVDVPPLPPPPQPITLAMALQETLPTPRVLRTLAAPAATYPPLQVYDTCFSYDHPSSHMDPVHVPGLRAGERTKSWLSSSRSSLCVRKA